jgi:biotin carboxyl carrier protein
MRPWQAAVLLGAAVAGCSRERVAKEGGRTGDSEARLSRLESGETGIVLDTAVVRRMGITTRALERSRVRPAVSQPAEIVTDPAAVLVVRASVSGRLTTGPGAAWPGFGTRVAAGDTLGQVSDALPIRAVRGGSVSRVLAYPGEVVQAGQELLEITDYDHPLARVAWPADQGRPPGSASLELPDGRRFEARLLGTAPEADPVTRGPAWLYRVSAGGDVVRPGMLVTIAAPDPHAGAGLLVPDSAVVQWSGLAWVFVARQPGTFVRVRVSSDHHVAGGWVVAEGLAPGDQVVTTGAEQLLSEEFRARIVVGEEVGE